MKTDEGELFVPGRTELIGNHTDHQGGRVVAATLEAGMRLRFRRREGPEVRLYSRNLDRVLSWPPHGDPHPSETMLGHSLELGGQGWEGELDSDLPSGGGLSSSAAFCVLLLRVQEALGGLKLDPLQRAVLAREMEVRAMGKPCGLMDQLVISVGGTVFLDFAAEPRVEPLGPTPFPAGWSLWLIDTAVSHQDLTTEYASIPADMERIAAQFGKTRLVDLDPEELLACSPERLRGLDRRALFRALHFFHEQERVERFRQAWKSGDWEAVLELTRSSGESSFRLLQNLIDERGQDWPARLLALLEMRRRKRGYPGSERIHGGGFGGFVQVYLPTEEEERFLEWVRPLSGRALRVWATR